MECKAVGLLGKRRFALGKRCWVGVGAGRWHEVGNCRGHEVPDQVGDDGHLDL